MGEPPADVDKPGAPSASPTCEVDRLLVLSILQNSILAHSLSQTGFGAIGTSSKEI